MPVNGGSGDADGLGDLIDAHPVIAALAEQFGRSQRDPSPPVLRPLGRGRCDCLLCAHRDHLT
jgi:hypothetical protein